MKKLGLAGLALTVVLAGCSAISRIGKEHTPVYFGRNGGVVVQDEVVKDPVKNRASVLDNCYDAETLYRAMLEGNDTKPGSLNQNQEIGVCAEINTNQDVYLENQEKERFYTNTIMQIFNQARKNRRRELEALSESTIE